MKVENYVRETAENFKFNVVDCWGNENSMILQGIGMYGKKKENDKYRRLLSTLLMQIPYENKYAGVACFYEMESGEAEVVGRIKNLMAELNNEFDSTDDEMALAFYTKYETKLGGKEHYQDVMNRYKAAYAKPEKNTAYFMTSVIEGIESIDQAVYEYYDGLKKLFKNALAEILAEEELDINDKVLAAYSILKACRLKVILEEKYEEIGNKWYEEVLEQAADSDVNKGAVVMLIAEKAFH